MSIRDRGQRTREQELAAARTGHMNVLESLGIVLDNPANYTLSEMAQMIIAASNGLEGNYDGE